ncbi:MAG: hypothetical protein AAF600_20705 [Bacteroidota bacterium]
MKNLLILLLTAFSMNIYAQEEKVYQYIDSELTTKPKPTQEFIDWLKENNEKLGMKAPYSSKKGTRVTLVFTVDKNGEIQNPKIWRGIGQRYDEYAHGLIKNNPNFWMAGATAKGNVATQIYYQLDFIKNANSIRNKANEPID